MWTAFLVGDPNPVFEARYPTSETLPSGRRATIMVRVTRRHGDSPPGWYPLLVRQPGGRQDLFAWAGDRLEHVVDEVPEESLPEPSTAAPEPPVAPIEPPR